MNWTQGFWYRVHLRGPSQLNPSDSIHPFSLGHKVVIPVNMATSHSTPVSLIKPHTDNLSHSASFVLL